MPTILVRVPEALDKRLAREARRARRTKGALILGILRASLQGNGRGQGKGAFELGRDIWGSVEGPGDLSHNPKYLDGYGKK